MVLGQVRISTGRFLTRIFFMRICMTCKRLGGDVSCCYVVDFIVTEVVFT